MERRNRSTHSLLVSRRCRKAAQCGSNQPRHGYPAAGGMLDDLTAMGGPVPGRFIHPVEPTGRLALTGGAVCVCVLRLGRGVPATRPIVANGVTATPRTFCVSTSPTIS
jgi:hypothetical protein